MGLTSRVREWRSTAVFEDVGGHRIFRRIVDGDGPTIVFLHGYPSSSYDFRLLLDGLAGRRLLLFDFLGFGLSDKPVQRYSLFDQAGLVETLVARHCDGPVLLVGHDMGTSVANELMARDLRGALPFAIDGVLLFNGSMVVEKAHLTPAQKVLRSPLGPVAARLSTKFVFDAQFRRIFSAAHPLTAEERDDQWALLAHNGGHRIADRLTAYIGERMEFGPRWHGAIRDWPGRLELAWALRDPVAVVDVLDAVTALRPSAPVTRWAELGHYPQIEDPAAVTAAIAAFAG
jgi:pimeloyl-ACP methyl ester carboxylesterase